MALPGPSLWQRPPPDLHVVNTLFHAQTDSLLFASLDRGITHLRCGLQCQASCSTLHDLVTVDKPTMPAYVDDG